VVLAGVVRTEDFDVAAVRKLEDPEARFDLHWPQAQHVLVEVRQLSLRSVRVPLQPKPVTSMLAVSARAP